MLAIVGMIVQESGVHIPGAQFTETDPFAAVSKVGFVGNMQILLTIGIIELATINKIYGDETPGDIGWAFGALDNMTEDQIKYRQEQEVIHCRLAMIAITGAVVQTLLF